MYRTKEPLDIGTLVWTMPGAGIDAAPNKFAQRRQRFIRKIGLCVIQLDPFPCGVAQFEQSLGRKSFLQPIGKTGN